MDLTRPPASAPGGARPHLRPFGTRETRPRGTVQMQKLFPWTQGCLPHTRNVGGKDHLLTKKRPIGPPIHQLHGKGASMKKGSAPAHETPSPIGGSPQRPLNLCSIWLGAWFLGCFWVERCDEMVQRAHSHFRFVSGSGKRACDGMRADYIPASPMFHDYKSYSGRGWRVSKLGRFCGV